EHGLDRPDRVGNGQQAANDDQRQSFHLNLLSDWAGVPADERLIRQPGWVPSPCPKSARTLPKSPWGSNGFVAHAIRRRLAAAGKILCYINILARSRGGVPT